MDGRRDIQVNDGWIGGKGQRRQERDWECAVAKNIGSGVRFPGSLNLSYFSFFFVCLLLLFL
jgi:hypothetical protein